MCRDIWVWDYVQHGKALVRALRQYSARAELSQDMCIVFTLATEYHIEPIVRWVSSLSSSRRPRVAVNLPLAQFWRKGEPRELYHSVANLCGRAFRSLERSAAAEHVRVFTQTDLLQSEYAMYGTVPTSVLPLPCSVLPDGSHRAGNVRRLAYLGRFRRDDEPSLLPFVIEYLRERLLSGAVALDIHVSATSSEAAECKSFMSLPIFKTPGVSTGGRYEEVLKAADLILLPYALNGYDVMAATPFVDALACGKPVIVPRGTWMAHELKKHGAGALFVADERLGLCECIGDALRDLDSLAGKAAAAADEWHEQHTARAVINTISGVFSS